MRPPRFEPDVDSGEVDAEGEPIFVQGPRIPWDDFDHYGKIMHLVPDALLNTRAGKITEWMDERPQPTYDEIDAVSYEDADRALLPSSDDVIDNADELLQLILDEVPGLRQRVTAKLKSKRGK